MSCPRSMAPTTTLADDGRLAMTSMDPDGRPSLAHPTTRVRLAGFRPSSGPRPGAWPAWSGGAAAGWEVGEEKSSMSSREQPDGRPSQVLPLGVESLEGRRLLSTIGPPGPGPGWSPGVFLYRADAYGGPHGPDYALRGDAR